MLTNAQCYIVCSTFQINLKLFSTKKIEESPTAWRGPRGLCVPSESLQLVDRRPIIPSLYWESETLVSYDNNAIAKVIILMSRV